MPEIPAIYNIDIVPPENRGPLSPNAHCTDDVSLAEDVVTFLPIGEGIWHHSAICFHCGLRYDGDIPQFCAGCGAGL
jgi:hypothetical protein